METLLPPEPPSVPHTPPYTPYRSKYRPERSDSPASSIHPFETVSPRKKATPPHRDTSTEDGITVQELVEGDVGYYSDVEVVYPEELEEAQSEIDSEGSSAAAEATGAEGKPDDDDAENKLSRRLSRLKCDGPDAAEAGFGLERRKRHLHRRTESRIYKRSHSQTVRSDTDVTDPDAMDDHGLTKSQRRLRRRVRGPEENEVVGEEMWSSTDATIAEQQGPSRATSEADLRRRYQSVLVEDEMDVDQGK